jgi:hypothetical protein
MKNMTRIIASIALIFILSGFSSMKTSSVLGLWVGEYTSLDRSVPVKVHFWQDEDGLKGAIEVQSEGTTNHPLSWVMCESTCVHFELVRDSGTLVFDGELKDGKISGDLLYSNLRGKFQLAPENLVSL